MPDASTSSDTAIRRGESFTVAGPTATVTCQKIFTPRGERLEFRSDRLDTRIRLDAVALEALTWQSPKLFTHLEQDQTQDLPVDRLSEPDVRNIAPGSTEADVAESLTAANEFAEIVCECLETASGDRLAVRSPNLGYAIQLDANALEALTWQNPTFFSQLLKEPFGHD